VTNGHAKEKQGVFHNRYGQRVRSARDAPAAQDGVAVFSNEKEFAKAAAEWPLGRLAETWNGFAGVAGAFGDPKPVKKFIDRPAAMKRIRNAIRRLAEKATRARFLLPNLLPLCARTSPKQPFQA